MHILNKGRLWQKPTRADKKELKQLEADASTGAPFKGRCINLSKGEHLPGSSAPTVEKRPPHECRRWQTIKPRAPMTARFI